MISCMTTNTKQRKAIGSDRSFSDRYFHIFFRSNAVALATLTVFSSSASAFDLKLEGLSGAALNNVEALLTTLRSNDNSQTRHTYRTLVDAGIRNGLEALGYYRYEIRYRWIRSPEGTKQTSPHLTTADSSGRNTLVASVKLGEPVKIQSATLTIKTTKSKAIPNSSVCSANCRKKAHSSTTANTQTSKVQLSGRPCATVTLTVNF